MVLESVLRCIQFCEQQKRYVCFDYINIYTDSKFVCDVLDQNGYPNFDYYYKLIEQIFILCHQIFEHHIIININKISSHIGIYGNETGDKIAKYAATLAKMCKYGENNIIKYQINKNPVQVDIAKDLIKLRINRKKERKYFWIDKLNNLKKGKLFQEEDIDRYIGNGLLIRSIVSPSHVLNRTIDMKKELIYLT